MDPQSIERYKELAKQLNVPLQEMMSFIHSMHKEEREEHTLQREQEKKEKLEEMYKRVKTNCR